MSGAKPKTPLGGFPHAKPADAKALDENLAVARSRLEGCLAARSSLWLEVLKISREGMLQPVLRLRDQAEQQSQWALQLERKIIEWERAKQRAGQGGML